MSTSHVTNRIISRQSTVLSPVCYPFPTLTPPSFEGAPLRRSEHLQLLQPYCHHFRQNTVYKHTFVITDRSACR